MDKETPQEYVIRFYKSGRFVYLNSIDGYGTVITTDEVTQIMRMTDDEAANTVRKLRTKSGWKVTATMLHKSQSPINKAR